MKEPTRFIPYVEEWIRGPPGAREPEIACNGITGLAIAPTNDPNTTTEDSAELRWTKSREMGTRLLVVVASVLMTVSPSSASVLAAEEPGAARVSGLVNGVVWVDADGDGLRGDTEEGLSGVTMTLRSSTGGDLANYATSWSCVNQTAGGAVVAGGNGVSGAFTMPNSIEGTGAAIVCTFVDEALALDFGDAPDTYDTTLASNGPRHGLPGLSGTTAALMLGASVDHETDGQPNVAADGDGGDEDGVDINPGISGSVMVVQAGTMDRAEVEVTGDGFLSAWIDLHHDGGFDPSEIVFDDEPVSDGLNTLSLADQTP